MKKISDPKAGMDVISIGYPGLALLMNVPTITQGIISKVLTISWEFF